MISEGVSEARTRFGSYVQALGHSVQLRQLGHPWKYARTLEKSTEVVKWRQNNYIVFAPSIHLN